MKRLICCCCCLVLMFILIGQAYGEIIGTWYGISDRLIYEVDQPTTEEVKIPISMFSSSVLLPNFLKIRNWKKQHHCPHRLKCYQNKW